MDRRSALPVGWPDFTFAYHGVPVVLEVKVERGRVRPEQEATLTGLPLPPNQWRAAVVRSVAEVKVMLDGTPGGGSGRLESTMRSSSGRAFWLWMGAH